MREVLEEAIALIRGCAGADLACYFVGTLPFVLALLYFLHDMRYDAFADRKIGAAALGLTFLYLWMKCWQATFARRLSARLGPSLETMRVRDLWSQAAIQPTSLFVLPLALILGLPFGWVYAYYQSLTVVGEPGAARHHALLWPRQNHALLLVLTAFRITVFLNILIVLMVAPEVLKALSGIESVFTRDPLALFNTTLLCVSIALTYLAVGPIGIAVYAVRCFYGEAVRSGHDLRFELKRLTPVRAGGAAAAIGLLVLCTASVGGTDASAAPAEETMPRRQTVESGELERSIEAVLQQREFAWQLQRQRVEAEEVEKGLIARAMISILEVVNGWARAVGRQIARVLEWLADRSLNERAERSAAISWRAMARVLLVVLVLAGIAALFYLVRRQRAKRRTEAVPIADFESPNVLLADDHEADRIDSDRWMEQAGELLATGELRSAMRAVYMAILSHLARGGILALAPAKTNRDYQRELARRMRSLPELPDIFSSGVMIFEKVWYGRHQPSREQLERLSVLFNEVRSRVEA
jgi:hypothetical protein